MKQHVETITNLLLGAAYADKRLEGNEVDAIHAILNKILGTTELPAERKAQIKGFNPARFDVGANTAKMQVASAEDKRKVLELIATVNDSDDELDLDESEYLKKVALGMGLQESSFADLTIEVLDDDELEHFFDAFEE
jgi:uncharacterized tellurite resistance protein B-like protein